MGVLASGLNHNGTMIAFSDKSFCSSLSTITKKEIEKQKNVTKGEI